MKLKGPPFRSGALSRSGLWTRDSQGPCLYCVPSIKPWALHFWSEPTTRMSFVRVTVRHIGSIAFLKLYKAESTYVPQTLIMCSRNPRGPAPQTRDRLDPPYLTYELWQEAGRKLKSLLGSGLAILKSRGAREGQRLGAYTDRFGLIFSWRNTPALAKRTHALRFTGNL